MGKIYILYYRWLNTANNHAGMAYLAKQLKQNHPNNFVLIKHPYRIMGHKYWGRKFYRFYAAIWSVLISLYLKMRLDKNDKVFFMEYGSNVGGDQQNIAKIMRGLSIRNKFFGLVHMPEGQLKQIFKTDDTIRKKVNLLDKVLVFGSSLQRYFNSLLPAERVRNTFHYVDTDYYTFSKERKVESDILQILCIGNQMRNNDLMHSIVKACPNVHFNICQGMQNLTQFYSDCKNVTLYGFIPESELLLLMQRCDVSLCVMNDTIGSNVITTSLACGLAMVVSDVGSIRDYCTVENTIFCANETTEFVSAIKVLDNNRLQCAKMQQLAAEKSLDFSLNKFINTTIFDLLDYEKNN